MGGCARERSRRRIRSAPGAQPQPSSPEAPHPTGRRARPQIFFWEPVRTGTPAERPIFTRRSARPAVATKCEARAADIGGDHAAFPERGAPAAGRQPADIKLRRRASVQRHGCWRGGQGVDMGRPRSEVKIRSGPLLPLDNALLILKRDSHFFSSGARLVVARWLCLIREAVCRLRRHARNERQRDRPYISLCLVDFDFSRIGAESGCGVGPASQGAAHAMSKGAGRLFAVECGEATGPFSRLRAGR